MFDMAELDVVAAGVIGIIFNADAMLPLGDLGQLYTRSKHTTLRLLHTLE